MPHRLDVSGWRVTRFRRFIRFTTCAGRDGDPSAGRVAGTKYSKKLRPGVALRH